MKKAYFIYDSLIFNTNAYHNLISIISEFKKTVNIGNELIIFIPICLKSYERDIVKKVNCRNIIYIDAGDILQYCRALSQKIDMQSANYVYCSSSAIGRVLSSWLSVYYNVGVIADTFSYEIKEPGSDHISYYRTTNNDSFLSNIKCISFPEIASIRPKKLDCFDFSNYESNVILDPQLVYSYGHTVIERNLILTNEYSNIIIGVGSGVSSKCMIEIKKFAFRNNIRVMCSKPLVESSLFSQDEQIGQSGITINSKVYIAVGISGAIQHIIGIVNVDKIIAINIDQNADIFEYADYSIVTDAFSIFEYLNRRQE